jgi:hypothetical protein
MLIRSIDRSINQSIKPKRKNYVRSMSSANMQPTAHMSTPGPYCWQPKSSSGARYHLSAEERWGVSPFALPLAKDLNL